MTGTETRAREVVGCPECGGPAEIEYTVVIGYFRERRLENAKVRCEQRHWFLMPREWIPEVPSETEARPPQLSTPEVMAV